MKSLIALWQEVSRELGTRCCVSTIRDGQTVTERFEHEGLSFLTIVLPSFASDLQKGLEQGKVSSDLFLGFRKRGGLPLFLGGFLRRVFEAGTGRLLDDPCVDSIFAIRQLTLLFSKILLPCSPEREEGAIQKFIKCEQEVRESDSGTRDALKSITRVSTLLFGDTMAKMDSDVYYGRVVPKHGPGKTADKLLGNKKFDQREWTTRLESVFPFGEYAIPNWRYFSILDQTIFLEPGQERPVKVVLVPKTLKTPRVIAIEPTCMQYMQQAVMEKLVGYLESSKIRDMIGFTSQGPNQTMARDGSRHENLATLDLSEASDRVSNQHVRALVHLFPHLREALDATRSRKADVPGYGVIRLAKFASMGSALCFPVEAMVFLTIVFIGIERELNRQLTTKDVLSFRGQVRVYGDDIIVPVRYTQSVIGALEDFGLRVNTDKSFWNGKFRESCGKEYYDGHDVSIVKVRRLFPSRLSDVPEIVSLVSLRNQFYQIGLWGTARWLDSKIGRILRSYPTVHPTSPVLGRHTVLSYQTDSMCPSLHSPRVRGYVVSSTPKPSKVSGVGALLKCFLKRSDEPFADRKHLERYGRPEAVSIKLRWVAPY